MNTIAITGNLTADIETKSVRDTTVASFTVADNGQREKPLFLPVEAWNMDHLPRYLSKGSKVMVQGALKQEQWKGKDGESRSRIVLTAQRVEFLDPAPKAARAKQHAEAF